MDSHKKQCVENRVHASVSKDTFFKQLEFTKLQGGDKNV